LRVNQDGRKLKHGGRHTFCPNSANFRRLSSELARRLAERYGKHPNLAVWHISNEYGNHCYCDQCAAAFRVWLSDRYGSLDELNNRWYTAFWGKTFTDWSQVETPTYNGERSIQGLLIDYFRFQSDSILACCRAEAAVLASITPGTPITTNLMGAFKPLDYHRWAKDLDIVAWDSYPSRSQSYSETAFAHSLMRGLKNGSPFMLTEQTPSQTNWQPQCALKRPGVMRLWSYQAMAHGADAIMYFQWRRSRGSAEKYHGAVVAHAGHTGTRVFKEVAALGSELKSLGRRTLGGRTPAKAAILFDWDNWHAIENSLGPTTDLKYLDICVAYFKALNTANIPVDVVSPEADFSGYDVVIGPVLYMVKPGVAERIDSFVQAGGTFVTTFFSGIVDETDLVQLGGYPAPFRKVLGIWVEEIDALFPGESNEVVFREGGPIGGAYSSRLLCDRIHSEGAEVLGVYGKDFYAGEPAVTVNSYGKGLGYYIGTALDGEGLQAVLLAVCRSAKVGPALEGAPDGVEVMPRVSPSGETLLYVLNHKDESARIPLPAGEYQDLLTGKSVGNALDLDAYGVAILAP
jgi:beta-galactosidase